MTTKINATTTAGVKIQPDNSGALELQTNNGTTAITIDTSQNVGIGTTTPRNASGYASLCLNNTTGAFLDLMSGGTRIGTVAADTVYTFGSVTSLPVVAITNGTERMRIDSSGNMLVGNAGLISGTTSSPRLYVVGTTPVVDSGAGGQQLIVTSSETSGGDKGGVIGLAGPSASSGVNIKATIAGKYDSAVGGNAGYMQFATINSGGALVERMRIDSSGNVLVGATSLPSNAGLLFVAGGISSNSGYQTKAGNTSALSGNRYNINWTGTAQLWIDSTNVGTFAFTSDYRIKKNIETNTTPALERIAQIRPVTYEFSNYGELFKEDGVAREGFIAHELAEVIPSAVEGEKDA